MWNAPGILVVVRGHLAVPVSSSISPETIKNGLMTCFFAIAGVHGPVIESRRSCKNEERERKKNKRQMGTLVSSVSLALFLLHREILLNVWIRSFRWIERLQFIRAILPRVYGASLFYRAI